MRSFTMIMLHAFVALTHAKELAVNPPSDAQDSMDKLADNLVHKLVDRLIASPIQDADLDSTTLGKTHPDKGLAMQFTKGSQSATPRGVAPSLPSRGVAPFLSAPYSASPSVGYRPQFHVEAMRGGYMQPTSGAVHSVEDKLKMYGIGSSPLEKLAITAIDACNHGNRVRDVSMMASKMSGETQEKLKRVAKDVVVRADALSKTKAEDMAGVTEPLGFFDPLGFTTGISEGKLLFYREVELKHGRVAMLASLGFLVGEQFHPLFGGNIDTPAYKAFQETPLETFWPAVIVAIAIPELFSVFTFNEPAWTQTSETEF